MWHFTYQAEPVFTTPSDLKTILVWTGSLKACDFLSSHQGQEKITTT